VRISPAQTVFVVLSFEGPDLYSQTGGLGVRVTGLSRALAEAGFETHLFFVGDPDLPSVEVQSKDRLHLHRWCQAVSAAHRSGVYDGEEEKVRDWNGSVPAAARSAATAAGSGSTMDSRGMPLPITTGFWPWSHILNFM